MANLNDFLTEICLNNLISYVIYLWMFRPSLGSYLCILFSLDVKTTQLPSLCSYFNPSLRAFLDMDFSPHGLLDENLQK